MIKNNIVLIGFRGCGKTTFGRAMAKELGLPFVDLDAEIEFLVGMPINEYVKKYNWQAFREMEQRVTHDFCRNFSGIIATGAGTLENSKNLQNLEKTGRFIFLNPAFRDVRRFLLKDTSRPRLNPDISLAQEIDQMWAQRKGIYGATANYEVVPELMGDPVAEAKKIIAHIPKDIIPAVPLEKSIAILSSSNGTTFQGLIDAKRRGRIPNITLSLLISDQPKCGAVAKAAKAEIEIEVLEKADFNTREDFDLELVDILRDEQPDIVLLAGWMRILSKIYCVQWGQKSINVHPSLLPKFAGLRDLDIYEKVFDHEEKYTGATFHRVSEEVDGGEQVLQRKVLVEHFDRIASLRAKVQRQEVLGFCEILERRK